MKEIRRKIIKILPRKIYLELLYRRLFGRKANLNNPRLFTEKLFWLKRYYEIYMPDFIAKLHDKYTVREYVSEQIGEKYLSKIYGVFEEIKEINFDSLPKSFMLKLTKLSGRNIPCIDYNNFDKQSAIDKFEIWLKEPEKLLKTSEEGYMLKGKTRIICEESLFTHEGTTPLEFTVHCFNGKARFIAVDIILNDYKGEITGVIRNLYDMNWKLMPINFGRERNENYLINKPDNFDELISVAEKLSKPFPYVRVDLYDIDNKIIFRELTWIPMGGNIKISPRDYDFIFGSWLELPDKKDKV